MSFSCLLVSQWPSDMGLPCSAVPILHHLWWEHYDRTWAGYCVPRRNGCAPFPSQMLASCRSNHTRDRAGVSIALLIALTTEGKTIRNEVAAQLFTSYFAISISLNVLLTLAISTLR